MAFRGEIIKMIENMVTSIEAHNFKITDTMKTHFVSFINEFFKHHVGTTDIDFKLTPNFLYAEGENIRVLIASDKNKKFEIPGYNIPMRNPIEGFILVDEMVCYDSVLMRSFAHPVPSSEAVNLPQYAETLENVSQATPTLPIPAPAPFTGFVFETKATPSPAPVATPSPAPAATPSPAPAATLSFAPAATPTNMFAAKLASPTNIFAAKPAPPTNIFNQSTVPMTSVATSPFAAFTGASPSSFSPKPLNTFSSFGQGTNIFSRADSTASSG